MSPKTIFIILKKKIDYEYLHCSIDVVTNKNGLIKIQTTGNNKNINIKRQAELRLFDNRFEIISIK